MAWAITLVIPAFAVLAMVRSWPTPLARYRSLAWSMMALMMLIELWLGQYWRADSLAWQSRYSRDIETVRRSHQDIRQSVTAAQLSERFLASAHGAPCLTDRDLGQLHYPLVFDGADAQKPLPDNQGGPGTHVDESRGRHQTCRGNSFSQPFTGFRLEKPEPSWPNTSGFHMTYIV